MDYRTPNIYDPSTLTEPYAYARANPTMFWDPNGLSPADLLLGALKYQWGKVKSFAQQIPVVKMGKAALELAKGEATFSEATGDIIRAIPEVNRAISVQEKFVEYQEVAAEHGHWTALNKSLNPAWGIFEGGDQSLEVLKQIAKTPRADWTQEMGYQLNEGVEKTLDSVVATVAVATVTTSLAKSIGQATLKPPLSGAPKSTPEGVVYRRTDAMGEIAPYGGQAKSEARYFQRQSEHARAHPDADFEFEIVGRAEPGQALDVLEHNTIQEMTGGVAARRSPLVSNKKDPVGGARRKRLGLPEPRRDP